MNIGDLVKITLKTDRDLFMSGFITRVEDDHVWATARTLYNYDFVLDGDEYDIEVIRAVEPKTVGTVHVDRNGVRWIKFTEHTHRDGQWISEFGAIEHWSYVEGQ